MVRRNLTPQEDRSLMRIRSRRKTSKPSNGRSRNQPPQSRRKTGLQRLRATQRRTAQGLDRVGLDPFDTI